MTINALSPVLFAEAFAKKMEAINHGKLAIIGSVAGDRGRQSNYIYGAAKSLIHCYAQGLWHRFANTSVKIILIKPAPTDTPMTAHLKNAGYRLASPQKVAQQIVSGINKNKTVIYTPFIWKWIMWTVRCIPNWLFAKLRM